MGTKYILITNFTMQKMLQAIQDYKVNTLDISLLKYIKVWSILKSFPYLI